MSTVTPCDTEGGNSETPSKAVKRAPQYRNWCFTLYLDRLYEGCDYVTEGEYLRTKLIDSGAKKFCAQVEKAPTTGKLHWQGWVMFENGKTLGGLNSNVFKGHWEKQKANDDRDAYGYTSKCETRVWGPIDYGLPKRVRDPLEGLVLYDWQQRLLNVWNSEPNPRKVYWIYGKTGNSGKSMFCKSLFMRGSTVVVQGGEVKDLINLVYKSVVEGSSLRCVCWDMPRGKSHKVRYEMIECLKNGMITNTKYETGVALFETVHVFVFANEAPVIDRMSEDRWEIWCLDGDDAEM